MSILRVKCSLPVFQLIFKWENVQIHINKYIHFDSYLFSNLACTMSSSRRSAPHDEESIYRIPPYYYIHVLDQNTNVTKVEVGPKTFIRQDNEKVIINDLSSLTLYHVIG